MDPSDDDLGWLDLASLCSSVVCGKHGGSNFFFSGHFFYSCHVLRILAVVKVFLRCMLKRCPLNVLNSSYAGV